MKKVYIVCYGSASQDDDGNANAYGNVHGVYAFLDDAKKGLEECKNECYDAIVNNHEDGSEAREDAEKNTRVYGSVEDDYFDIDYKLDDTPCEIYIKLVEKEIIR